MYNHGTYQTTVTQARRGVGVRCRREADLYIGTVNLKEVSLSECFKYVRACLDESSEKEIVSFIPEDNKMIITFNATSFGGTKFDVVLLLHKPMQ